MDSKVGQFTSIFSYSQYFVDTGMAVLVLMLYQCTIMVIKNSDNTGISSLKVSKFTNEKQKYYLSPKIAYS